MTSMKSVLVTQYYFIRHGFLKEMGRRQDTARRMLRLPVLSFSSLFFIRIP